MQKSCRVGFMYGELTDPSTIEQIDRALDEQQPDQFEILLYKKNSELIIFLCFFQKRFTMILDFADADEALGDYVLEYKMLTRILRRARDYRKNVRPSQFPFHTKMFVFTFHGT